MSNKVTLENKLEAYTTEPVRKYLISLIEACNVNFRLSRKRKSKLGDFKVDRIKKEWSISINENLSNEQFLVTTIHELAHAVTWEKFGNRVSPHGKEWKKAYKELFLPVIPMIEDQKFRRAVLIHIENPKASSFSDHSLLEYFSKENQHIYKVEDVPFNESFTLGNKTFVKLKKLRKRYLCEDKNTSRRYYVHAHAEVSGK